MGGSARSASICLPSLHVVAKRFAPSAEDCRETKTASATVSMRPSTFIQFFVPGDDSYDTTYECLSDNSRMRTPRSSRESTASFYRVESDHIELQGRASTREISPSKWPRVTADCARNISIAVKEMVNERCNRPIGRYNRDRSPE